MRAREGFDRHIPDEPLPQLQTVGAVTTYAEGQRRLAGSASTARARPTTRAWKKKG